MRTIKECKEIFAEYTTGPIVMVAAKDTLAHAEALLSACKAQHEAIDRLCAMLCEKDPDFFPSQSGQPWAALLEGNLAIKNSLGDK